MTEKSTPIAKIKDLDALMLQLDKEFGKGTAMIIETLGEGGLGQIERIPIDSPSIGDILGDGGLPRGRMIEIYGPESSGKTSLACYFAGQAQKVKLKDANGVERNGVVAYIDAEHAIDVDYAESFGFQIKKAIMVQPDSGEQALDVADRLAGSGLVDFIVIDSVAALTPRAELEGDMGDSHMGLQARLLSQACRKLVSTVATNKVVIIWINQIRMKIGVMFGNPECVTPETLIEVKNDRIPILGDLKIPISEIFRESGKAFYQFNIGESVDISNKNIFVKSVNADTWKLEYKRVLSVIRKEDSPVVQVLDAETRQVVFMCSHAHRIWALDRFGTWRWMNMTELLDMEDPVGKLIDGRPVDLIIRETGLCMPILDISVEDNENYFANGILSHNTTTGGNALKFYCSIRLDVRRIEYLPKDGGEKVYGMRMRVKSVKNKTAPPMKSRELEIFFGKGFQVEGEWVDYAVTYGVIEKSASWYILPNKERCQGKNSVINALKERPELYEEVKRQTKERMHSGQSKPMDGDPSLNSRMAVDPEEETPPTEE